MANVGLIKQVTQLMRDKQAKSQERISILSNSQETLGQSFKSTKQDLNLETQGTVDGHGMSQNFAKLLQDDEIQYDGSSSQEILIEQNTRREDTVESEPYKPMLDYIPPTKMTES